MTLEPAGWGEPPTQDDRCGRCGKGYGEHQIVESNILVRWKPFAYCTDVDGDEFEPRDEEWEAARAWDAACERGGV